jgi:hypothetical protein
MKRTPKNIPDSVRASIWFANPEQLDWEGQKSAIITSILNRGTWEAVRWVHNFYGEDEMRDVVSHPKRGHWFPQSLQFWLTFFKVSLDPRSFELALFHL